MTVEAAVPEIEMMTTAAAGLPTEEEMTTIAVADPPVADATMMMVGAGTAILGATPKPPDAVGKIAMTAAEAVAVHLEVATTTTIEADEAPPEAVETTTAGVAKAVGSATMKGIPKLLDAVGKTGMTAAEVEVAHPADEMTTMIEEDEALLEAVLATTMTIAMAEALPVVAEMTKVVAGSEIRKAIPKPLDVVGKIATTAVEAEAVPHAGVTMMTIEAETEALPEVAPVMTMTIVAAGAHPEVGTMTMAADGTEILAGIRKLPDAAGKIAMTAAEAEAVHPEVAMTTTIEEDEALLEAALDTTMTIAAVAVPHVAEMMTMDAVGMATPRVTPKPLARAGKAETAARAMTMIAADADADARLQ
jgi:hypothetical protein